MKMAASKADADCTDDLAARARSRVVWHAMIGWLPAAVDTSSLRKSTMECGVGIERCQALGLCPYATHKASGRHHARHMPPCLGAGLLTWATALGELPATDTMCRLGCKLPKACSFIVGCRQAGC